MLNQYSTEIRLLLDVTAYELNTLIGLSGQYSMTITSSYPWISDDLRMRCDEIPIQDSDSAILVSLFDDGNTLPRGREIVLVGFVNRWSHKGIRYPQLNACTHRRVQKQLAWSGYRPIRSWGIFGPDAVIQFVLSQAFSHAGRYDLAQWWSDRAALSLVKSGHLRNFCALGLVVATP